MVINKIYSGLFDDFSCVLNVDFSWTRVNIDCSSSKNTSFYAMALASGRNASQYFISCCCV